MWLNWSQIAVSPGNPQNLDNFEQRRGSAYQAYYEHMPLRLSALPQGANMQLYRRFTFGNLAEFNVLDTRQYRVDPRPEIGIFNLDQWDGYVAARKRLLSFLEQQQTSNPVVITIGLFLVCWNLMLQLVTWPLLW